eukprot:29731-Hanusia_phi.AAC.4
METVRVQRRGAATHPPLAQMLLVPAFARAPRFVATDHPSCSKQHAVIQFRQHEKVNPEPLVTWLNVCDVQDDGIGGVILSVRPYLMDLKTTNGEAPHFLA